MATYTPNYQLHQWVPGDNFLRTDFNEDFQKIDTALAEMESSKADSGSMSSQLSGINSAIDSLEDRLEVRVGSYIGDGTANRSLWIGFTPAAVFVEHNGGQRLSSGIRYGGLAIGGKPCNSYNGIVVDITLGGFIINKDSSTSSNEKDTTYYYIAFK